MGTPLTLPPSAKEYIDGMGIIVRRDEGEFLVTDQNFMALDEPRSLPKPAQRWQFREPILAGDRPLWILSNDLGIDGIEMSLFDPVALRHCIRSGSKFRSPNSDLKCPRVAKRGLFTTLPQTK